MKRTGKKYAHTVGITGNVPINFFKSTNVKIDSMASDLFGVTGRNWMQLLVYDRKAVTLSDIQGCVRGKLRGKEAELLRPIQGFVTDHHRFILRTILETITILEAQVGALDHEIRRVMNGHKPLLDCMKKAPDISYASSFKDKH